MAINFLYLTTSHKSINIQFYLCYYTIKETHLHNVEWPTTLSYHTQNLQNLLNRVSALSLFPTTAITLNTVLLIYHHKSCGSRSALDLVSKLTPSLLVAKSHRLSICRMSQHRLVHIDMSQPVLTCIKGNQLMEVVSMYVERYYHTVDVISTGCRLHLAGCYCVLIEQQERFEHKGMYWWES